MRKIGMGIVTSMIKMLVKCAIFWDVFVYLFITSAPISTVYILIFKGHMELAMSQSIDFVQTK
jgi:hypothetical protein